MYSSRDQVTVFPDKFVPIPFYPLIERGIIGVILQVDWGFCTEHSAEFGFFVEGEFADEFLCSNIRSKISFSFRERGHTLLPPCLC